MINPNAPLTGPQANQQPPRFKWLSTLIWLALFSLLLFWVFPSLLGQGESQSNETVTYSTFIAQVNNNNVQSVTITDYTVTGVFKSPVPSADGSTKSTHFTTTVPQFGNADLIALLQANQVVINVQPSSNASSFWLSLLLYIGPFILIILLFWWMGRRVSSAQNGIFSFSKSKPRLYMGGKTNTTFEDVAGVDEAKAELVEVVDFLKAPARYEKLGGKIPRGILLVGPPGTGKTLLAKAVAGEADVPFFSMSGSEFVEMLVGVGASRVRDLFEKASKSAPCIVFIDELDAVGRQRGAGLGGGNDEREQTLNQILVEMDGFDPHQAMIVLAATNRPDVLDPALLRPGRFDRQITVDRPDRAGREAILRVHVRGVPLAPDVKLDELARATPGFSGADLANLVNEAALMAAGGGRVGISKADFEAALDKIVLGVERPHLRSEEERRVVAYHEAGHALVAVVTPGADPVQKVTIIPRGRALGVTEQIPVDDRLNYPRSFLL